MTIRLTTGQASRLKPVATARGISLAELVRQCVDQCCQHIGGEDDEARRQRAIAAVSKYHSGHRDISEKHDEYLAEAL